MAQDSFQITTGSGYKVPVEYFSASSQQVIIFLPALGVKARFYQSLAKEFQKQGQSIILFEQRGHGESSVRASSSCNWSYKEYLQEDVPAVFSWCQKQFPDKRLVLAGHSMGGHMSLCSSSLHPDIISQVVLIGCGSPWMGSYRGWTRLQLSVLNLSTWFSINLLGYYPGHRLGFGGREAAGFIRDWRHLLNRNQYQSDDIDFDFETEISRFNGQVLSLSFDADHFAPYPSVKAVIDKLSFAQLTHRLIKSKKVGFQADHFSWAKAPESTVSEILAWMGDSQSKPLA